MLSFHLKTSPMYPSSAASVDHRQSNEHNKQSKQHNKQKMLYESVREKRRKTKPEIINIERNTTLSNRPFSLRLLG
jgi:hypothetical protein